MVNQVVNQWLTKECFVCKSQTKHSMFMCVFLVYTILIDIFLLQSVKAFVIMEADKTKVTW